MAQFKRILVVIDPTATEQPAMARATWVAKKTGASIELFICDYDQYLSGERFFDSSSMEKARQSLIDTHKKRLEKLAQGIAADGISVFVDACWDHPLHDGIVRKVVRSAPDIVFKDTHYHAAIRRSIFSNTDWNLIRDCPAPEKSGAPPTTAALLPALPRFFLGLALRTADFLVPGGIALWPLPWSRKTANPHRSSCLASCGYSQRNRKTVCW